MNATLKALAAFARLGWRETAADRLGLFGRALLFSLPVMIFAAIWRATPLAGSLHDADRLTWYVMITETIIFAPGYVFREIEEDIRTGAVEAALTRPLPYVLARVAEEAAARCCACWCWAPSARCWRCCRRRAFLWRRRRCRRCCSSRSPARSSRCCSRSRSGC
jgi:ABC-type uncharacterized transport system permease subunit